MNMKLDFNLTLCVLTVEIAGYICFGNEDGNVTYWTDAVKECQLATPDITLDDEGYRAYVQDAEWSGQVWTGYYMSSLAFDYIDCVRTPERKPDYINNLNAPGTCHSICKTSDTVGLKGDECYCLNNEQFEKTAQPSCDILCDSVENVACGGHQHMSIYRISNVDSKKTTNGRHYPWKLASSECFEHQKIPTPYETALYFTKVLTGIYWTGTIRSPVIHKYDGEIEEGSYIRYGYLTMNENNIPVVKFSENKKKMKSLCQNKTVKEQIKQNLKRSVPAYIIVAVIAVLIIIGAAVATFLWRKRRSSFYRQKVPVKYESGENDYTTPTYKEDDGNIYSEIVDTSETRSGQCTDKDGYEVPL